MLNNPTINSQNLRPFKYFCMTIGAIPSSYMEAMSYQELLIWFCDYLKNDSILDNLKKDLNSITEKIISIGISEDIVQKDNNKDYQRFVMRSACSGIANSFCENKSTDLEICKAYAYEFIKRSLNLRRLRMLVHMLA